MGASKNITVSGIHPVLEALRSGKEIEKIYVRKEDSGRVFRKLNTCLSSLPGEKANKLVQFVPGRKLNFLAGNQNHQGVVALLSPITYRSIEEILPGIFEKGETPLLLLLERITDVRNFGAICRNAECAGVHAIIIPWRGSAQINSDAVKTSAGALFNIPICRSINLKHTIDFLKQSGLQLVACTEKAEQNIYQVDFSLPTALLLGSEENGISPEYLNRADAKARIPLLGKIQSLNVSSATAVALYEAVRQRGNFSDRILNQ